MSKLTMFLLAAVTAATVAIGALAASTPSASAATATTRTSASGSAVLPPICFPIYIGSRKIVYCI
jgi:hypothetical protein